MNIQEILGHHILDHALHLKLFGVALPVTVHTVYMISISLALIFLLPLIMRSNARLLKSAVEGFVVFVREDIVIPNMGEDGRRFVPFFATLLIFLLFANYIGFIPGSRTITANISITLGMAAVSGMMIIFTSIRTNGFAGFLKTFIPHGVPWPLIPLLFPLEVISLIIKVFVLAIRLFANMVAGHMGILVLFCFIFIMALKSAAAGYGAIAPVLVMTLFLTVLELLVAAIQAYVFTLLTAIFTGLQMHAH